MASAAPAPSPVDAYKRQANEVLDMIDEKLSVYPIVQQVAAKTTLRPSHLTLAAMSLLIAFVWWSEHRRTESSSLLLCSLHLPLFDFSPVCSCPVL